MVKLPGFQQIIFNIPSREAILCDCRHNLTVLGESFRVDLIVAGDNIDQVLYNSFLESRDYGEAWVGLI